MVVERIVPQHRGIEHHRDASVAVVDEREGRDAAGLDAEDRAHLRRRAEREAWRGEAVRERLQVEAALLEHDDEPEPALPVFEEQALAVPARERAAQRHRLGDGEDRRMGVGAIGDAERVEAAEEVCWRCRRIGHGGGT